MTRKMKFDFLRRSTIDSFPPKPESFRSQHNLQSNIFMCFSKRVKLSGAWSLSLAFIT